MATNEKVIELSNRVKSIKSSDNPEVNHIIAGADDIFDDSKRKKQSTINQETDEALNDRYTKEETYSKSQLNNMVAPQHDYITVATYADLSNLSEHPIGCVYRVSNYDGTNSQVDATKYSEYSWDGTQYIHLATKSQVGEVFDISAYHATGGELAKYADLVAALDSNNGGGVPLSLQKGGMRIQFVSTSDNKYVQYRLMSDTFNTSVINWKDDDFTKFQRTFIHNPAVNSDLTRYDVYTFKPNSVYRIRPSYDTFPEQTTSQWDIALISYLNGVSTTVTAISQNAGKAARNYYFLTPSEFDYIRVGLRGVPFYSVEIDEVKSSDNIFSENIVSDQSYSILYPVNKGGKYKLTIQAPYSGQVPQSDDCLSIVYFTGTSEIEVKSLNRIKCINNVVDIEIPDTAIAIGVKPVYNGTMTLYFRIDKVYYDNKDPYKEQNILPLFSRLDDNTVINTTPSTNFWGAFQGATTEIIENYIRVNKPSTSQGEWPGIRTNFVPEVGRKVCIKFRYKASAPLTLFFATNIYKSIPASEDWAVYELETTVTDEYDRLQVSMGYTNNNSYFDIRDFVVSYPEVGSIESGLRELKPKSEIAYDSVLSQLNTPFDEWDNKAVKIDGTINESVPAFKILLFRVNPKCSYLFSGRMHGNATSYFISWFDINGNFIEHKYRAVANTENLYEDVLITAPDNATYLYMNCLKSDETYYKLKGLTDYDKAINILNKVVSPLDRFTNKKISILGDSISTALNNNAVQFTVLASDISNNRTLQGYPTYYDIGTIIGNEEVTSAMVGVLTSFTPVSGDEGKTIGKPLNYNAINYVPADKVWWRVMADKLKATILQNVSWSGASISSHESGNDIYKTSYAWHDAQISKLATRDNEGNAITPDIVIIYRGTNDMTHSPYSKLTDFGAGATAIPDNDSVANGFGFKEAYAITIKKIREAYPNAEIVCCTLNVFKRIVFDHFPTRNGTNTLPEFNNAIREVANQMGCNLIEFDKDGITFENCYPTYISDNAGHPTHPNPTGHAKMAEKAVIDILK